MNSESLNLPSPWNSAVQNELDPVSLYPNLPLSNNSAVHLTDDSWFLLSNYRDNLIPLLCPLNLYQKSSWHHIILPMAMNTMAQMMMGGSVSFACSALLYSLLATSALHLQGEFPGDYIESSAEFYQKHARPDLRQCFQKEVNAAPKRTKYKEVLMAILATATLFVRSIPRLNCKFITLIYTNLPISLGLSRRFIFPPSQFDYYRTVYPPQRLNKKIALPQGAASSPLLCLLPHCERNSASIWHIDRPYPRTWRSTRLDSRHKQLSFPHPAME